MGLARGLSSLPVTASFSQVENDTSAIGLFVHHNHVVEDEKRLQRGGLLHVSLDVA
jgi:hypothetical protein